MQAAERCNRLVEFRIVLPMTLDEYQRGQLFSTAKTSDLNANASEGFETLKNEQFKNAESEDPRMEEGIYTEKILHLGSRAPKLVRVLTPKNMLMLEEKCWNCFPYVKTVYHSPFFGARFVLSVETVACDDDHGTNPNALSLTPEELKMREVDWIDIVKDPLPQGGLVCLEDPSTFHSKVTGRGPLAAGFEKNCEPAVCVYKVVRCNLDFGPFQKKAESILLSSGMRDLLLPLHRQIFCWMDEWHGMTLEQVHAYELAVQEKQNSMGFATGGLPSPPTSPPIVKPVVEERQFQTRSPSPMSSPEPTRATSTTTKSGSQANSQHL